jgi:triphosphatase
MKVLTSAPDSAEGRDVEPPRPAAAGALPAAHARGGGGAALAERALREVQALHDAWLAHEPGARLGEDPEAVHQLRVTARRLDATLGLFKQCLPAPLVRARKTAKALLRTLGATRDLDVQLGGLTAYCAHLPAHERSALEPLRERLLRERSRARARMLRALDGEPTRRWLHTLAGAAAAAPAAAADDAAALVPQRVRRRFRRLRKAVRRLRTDSPMEDYHRVRRRAKQLRYALEAGAFLFGRPGEEMLKALRRLQDKLGANQDAYMARSRLIALASAPACALPAATLFHMGRLAEHHARTAAEARAALPKAWRKVRGRRWKALRAKLAEAAAEVPRTHEPQLAPAHGSPGAGHSPPVPGEPKPLTH